MTDGQQSLYDFVRLQSDKLLDQTVTHLGLTCLSLTLAIVVGGLLGILIVKRKRTAAIVLTIAGIFQTIPSIAFLGFMIPILGIGILPAITALFMYALLPIIRNTYTGIAGIDRAIIEAAQALGMDKSQILFQVQLPLAMPVILAGIRTAAVVNVGVATLAAYIGAGGLGEFIFGGIALNNTNMILAGAIPAALLAVLFDFGISKLQKSRLKSSLKSWIFLPVMFVLLSSFYISNHSSKTFTAGFTPEFMGREDGYLGLTTIYDFKIPTVVLSDAIMYQALFDKHLDIISGYSTDGRLKAFNLVTLEDDKHIFPPYYVAPMVRNETLRSFPELKDPLEALTGLINDSIMTELNYRVDYLKRSPESVAADFLKNKGLLKSPGTRNKGVIRLGSKIFGEQYILIHMYKLLIEGSTNLKVETRTGLGGTKICFDALTNDEIDMYPEYTGTGLLVILRPTQQILKDIMRDKQKVYDFVKTEFDKRYHISWLKPIGFNNAYALMMRKEESIKLKINKISDLQHYTTDARRD